jgi:hypothetical protein
MWVSLCCMLIAGAALLSDKILMQLLKEFFNASYSIKSLSFSTIAAGMFYYGFERKITYPLKVYSNETFIVFGVAAIASAIYQLGMALNLDILQIHYLLGTACLIYGAIACYFKSNLVWVVALLSLGSWFGAQTGYLSGWGAYYLGMNYPIRFIVLGGTLTLLGLEVSKYSLVKYLSNSTLIIGLLYVFIAAWILSIFGDYTNLDNWYFNVMQTELLNWSLLFAGLAIAAIYHGLRNNNSITNGFGITFLLLNMYTKYFEYFWHNTNKIIFFSILAVSFWYLGTYAEKIWNLGKK